MANAGVIVSRSLKVAAIVVGGPLAILGGMALAGVLVENGWARLGIAFAAVIVVPAIVADRLLPEDPERGRGIVSDVLAIAWLGAAFAVFGIGISATQPLLDDEAARLEQAEWTRLAKATRWLAGGEPLLEVAPAIAAKPIADEKKPDDKAPPVATSSEEKPADPPKPDDKPATPEELFAKWAPSVVTIRVGSLMMEGGGTGFVIDSRGTIITNHHVVTDSTQVSVKTKSGKWADKVELLFQDEARDVAILRVSPAADFVPTTLGDSEAVKVGERVISIGNPLGLEHTLTDGLVSARRTIEGKRMIQSTAPISPGNSGGPLFNMLGEVIGVTTATMSGFGMAQNLNLAIPINEVKAFFKDDYPDKKVVGGGGPEAGTW